MTGNGGTDPWSTSASGSGADDDEAPAGSTSGAAVGDDPFPPTDSQGEGGSTSHSPSDLAGSQEANSASNGGDDPSAPSTDFRGTVVGNDDAAGSVNYVAVGAAGLAVAAMVGFAWKRVSEGRSPFPSSSPTPARNTTTRRERSNEVERRNLLAGGASSAASGGGGTGLSSQDDNGWADWSDDNWGESGFESV